MIAFNNRSDIFHIRCDKCGVEYQIVLDERDFDAWQKGDCYIQDCLAYLSAAERELLISQTCNDCWKKLYGEDLDE